MKTLSTILFFLCISATAYTQSLFHEDFENPDSVVSSGSIGFAQCTRIAAGGNACDSSSYGVGDTCYLTTIPFSTVGQSTVVLSFDQICKIEFFDKGYIQVSSDSGNTWINLTCSQYLLGNSLFCAQGNSFAEYSYGLWSPGFAITPDNSWWKPEKFDISSLVANMPNVLIRFKLSDHNNNGMSSRTGWYLDNIEVDTSYLTASQYFWYSTTNCGVPQFASFYSYFNYLGYAPTDSFLINMDFGDGSDTTYYLSPGTFTDSLTHFYVNAGGYNAILTVTDVNGYSVYDSTAFLVVGGSGCSTITGKVYVDQNSNCIYDIGDYPISGALLNLDSLGVFYGYAGSDSAGNYQFNIPDTGAYNIVLNSNSLNSSTLCPANDTIFVNALPSSNNDFALSCQSGYDVLAFGLFAGWSTNSTFGIYGAASDAFCQSVTGDFKIVFDSRQLYNFAYPPGYTISGDTVTWPSVLFGPSTYSTFQVRLQNGPLISFGDTIHGVIIAGNLPGDINPANNIANIYKIVTSSFDPNFKEVNPPNEIDTNATLDYTIHFQNTGNDTAFKIIITDTLDSNLDLSTLTINGGSHNFSTNVYPNNLLVFTFDPIQLPDSGHNQIESNGFVSYSIKLKGGTAVGTHIRNNSYIFFDANQPVITNTTDNVIVIPNAIQEVTSENQISVFPNPTSDNVIIKSNKPIEKIKVLNLLGAPVYRSNGNLKNEITIPLSNFSKGVYTLIIESENKIIARKFLKM